MIKALFWNIRGIAKSPNFRRLKTLVRLHKLAIVGVCEPKLSVGEANNFRVRLNFDSVLCNGSGDIWVFFNAPFSCELLRASTQCLSLSVSHPHFSGSVVVSFVHAKWTLTERVPLWRDLLQAKPQGAWCVLGDFNVVVDPSEKKGGRPYQASEGLELLDFMTCAGVFDAGYSGSRYTWCNNRLCRHQILN